MILGLRSCHGREGEAPAGPHYLDELPSHSRLRGSLALPESRKVIWALLSVLAVFVVSGSIDIALDQAPGRLPRVQQTPPDNRVGSVSTAEDAALLSADKIQRLRQASDLPPDRHLQAGESQVEDGRQGDRGGAHRLYRTPVTPVQKGEWR